LSGGNGNGGKGGHKISASHIRLSYIELAKNGADYF
jgi:hypothetical protein